MAKEEDKELIAKQSIRRVKKNAIGVSRIAGTPQTARFAVMNLTNESIYLSQDSGGQITDSQLSLKARVISLGDQKEYRIQVPDGDAGYDLTIESELVQSELQAKEISSMISRSFNRKFNSIELKIFGNPLLEIGDIVVFNYENKNIQSKNDEYYVITRINNDFSEGLQTSITIKPLMETSPISK